MFSYQIANKYSGAAYGKLIVNFQKQDLRHQKNKKTEELKGVQNLPKNSWRFFLPVRMRYGPKMQELARGGMCRRQQYYRRKSAG